MREIQFLDQDDRPIELDIRHDGGAGGAMRWVTPNKRTRITATHCVVAVRIDRIELGGNLDDWWIHDIKIGNRSHMYLFGSDTIEGDGLSANDFMKIFGRPNEKIWETAQTSMPVAFDVTYRGPNPEGQPFACTVRCTAVR